MLSVLPISFTVFVEYFLLLVICLGKSNGVPKIGGSSAFPAQTLALERELNDSISSIPTPSSILSEEGEESKEDYNKRNCIQLPSNDHSSTTTNDQVKLPDLLSNRFESLIEDDNVEEAVLIMGNTGCGKTTLTQIIATNLTSLHAVLTPSGGLVIIDDSDRIGAPSTFSKTLIPELVIGEDGTHFYDCPGFDDNIPEKDIAANLLINQIIQKVPRVKIIFLVVHNSVKPGQDRQDFDLLASYAAKLLRNVPKYRSSLGLVITKVANYNEWGRYLKDKNIIKETAQFLKMYLGNLQTQLGLRSNSTTVISRNELEGKIEFVEGLLEKNKRKKYGRISFSRNPTECGKLSDIKVVSDTKKMLTKLYSEELEYAPVNPEDFGFSLKDKTKLAILEYVKSLNNDIRNGFAQVMSELEDWFDAKYLQRGNLITKLGMLERSTNMLERSLEDWNPLQNKSNPEDLLSILKSNLNPINYVIPQNISEYMNEQQSYFELYDRLNEAEVNRAVTEWSQPVEETTATFKKNLELAELEMERKARFLHFADRSTIVKKRCQPC